MGKKRESVVKAKTANKDRERDSRGHKREYPVYPGRGRGAEKTWIYSVSIMIRITYYIHHSSAIIPYVPGIGMPEF
jgi:hypothetical protein